MLNGYFFKKNRANALSVLRLLLPEHDRERGNYNLKENRLAKLISKFN